LEVFMTKRREFILTCGTGAMAGLVPGALLAASLPDYPGGPDDGTSLGEHFRSLVDGVFRFRDPASGAQSTARLSAVNAGPEDPRLDQFSLQFRGDAGAAMAEGTYRVTDPNGRSLDLFVIPGAPQGGAPCLRAEICILV
jgi:hypothetical protein